MALALFMTSRHRIEKGVLCGLRETRMLKRMATASSVVHVAVLGVELYVRKAAAIRA